MNKFGFAIVIECVIGLVGCPILSYAHFDPARVTHENADDYWATSSGTDAAACGSGIEGLPDLNQLRAYISQQTEQRGVEGLNRAAQSLTALNPGLKNELSAKVRACEGKENEAMCRLLAYWSGDEEAALRALAIYWGTGVVVKHSSSSDKHDAFEIAQIRTIERAIRRFPPSLRRQWLDEQNELTNPNGEFAIYNSQDIFMGGGSYLGSVFISREVIV